MVNLHLKTHFYILFFQTKEKIKKLVFRKIFTFYFIKLNVLQKISHKNEKENMKRKLNLKARNFFFL